MSYSTKRVVEIIVKAQNNSKQELNGVSQLLKTLSKAAGVAAVALAAMKMGKKILEFARLGAQADRLSNSFMRLAGGGRQSERMLTALQEATKGTISNTALMTQANSAMMLGVTQDADEMARLTEIAIARGQALGKSASYSMESMITGLGRLSPKWLDNIGIVINSKQAYDAYAISLGKVASELTEQEKRQALVNEVLKDGIELEEDLQSNTEQLAAAIENLKTELGLTVVELVKMEGATATLLDTISDGIEKARKDSERVRELRAQFSELRKMGVLTRKECRYIEASFNSLDACLLSLSIEEYERMVKELLEIYPTWRAELAGTTDEIWNQVDALKALDRGEWLPRPDTSDAFKDHVKALEEQHLAHKLYVAETIEDELRAYEEYKRTHELTQKELMDINDKTWKLRQDVEKRNEAALLKTQEDAASESKRLREKQQDEARQQASQRRSDVESILRPTQVTDIDMARTQLGEYIDKWDEYIRRIRSAATDSESAWKHLIPEDVMSRGEDAIKVWAAEQERLFYSGLLPEQVDWAGFDRAWAQFLREREGRKKLIAEAMRRTGGTEADIMAALGMPSTAISVTVDDEKTKEVADETVNTITERFKETPLGTTLVTTLDSQLKERKEEIKRIGVYVGVTIAEGVEGSMPDFADVMVEVLGPKLANWTKQRGYFK